jgi:hypothetical protein
VCGWAKSPSGCWSPPTSPPLRASIESVEARVGAKLATVAGALQNAVVPLVSRILGAEIEPTPGWLPRPGKIECSSSWETICRIYHDLTGLELPETMPPRETRGVDAVLDVGDGHPRVLEVDETQHFNRYRAGTLRSYPKTASVAFPVEDLIAQSEKKTGLEGGGFGKSKPPLFPAEYGRHQQRAFRDTLADLLPLEHGWAPTLRIGDSRYCGGSTRTRRSSGCASCSLNGYRPLETSLERFASPMRDVRWEGGERLRTRKMRLSSASSSPFTAINSSVPPSCLPATAATPKTSSSWR